MLKNYTSSCGIKFRTASKISDFLSCTTLSILAVRVVCCTSIFFSMLYRTPSTFSRICSFSIRSILEFICVSSCYDSIFKRSVMTKWSDRLLV